MQEKNKYINRLYPALKGQNVLKGVNLAIKPGKHFGLGGMNDAGKTTLIKSLLDYCQVAQTNIRFFDTPHHQTRGLKRQAFLPECYAPPYDLAGQGFLLCVAEPESVA